MRRRLAGVVGLVLLAGAGSAATVRAQEPGEQMAPGPGGFRGMQRVVGTVTAVNGASLTVKSIEDGTTSTVVTTTNTRLMKQGGTMQLSDVKPGDGVMAMGQLDAPTKTLHAGMLTAMTPDQTKRMETMAAEAKANLGKTYIAGRVTAIDLDNLKMTVQRPDGQAQTIGFDEGTSFKKGARVTGVAGMGGGGGFGGGGGRRDGEGGGAGAAAQGASTPAITGGESITLADIKVGDNVIGFGAVKAGTFIPTALNVPVAGEGGGRRRGGQPGAAPATPPANGPGL